MKTIILAFLAGSIEGAIFGKVGLPVPAPPTVAGIMGIVGIMVGYMFVTKFL